MTVTYGGGEKVEDDVVHLRLHPAQADGAALGVPIDLKPLMPFTTWQVVKRVLKNRLPRLAGIPDTNIRLLHKSIELQNGRMIDDYNLPGGTQAEPAELTYLVTDPAADVKEQERGSATQSIGIYVDSNVPSSSDMRALVAAALDSMRSGVLPRLTDEGTGATYIIKDAARHSLAVFKPKDEEAFAPQNPRGYVGPENARGLREGVLSTQQAAREVAAFLLDHGRFVRVPETALVHAKHPNFSKCKTKSGNKVVWKIGAFQKFVQTKDTAGNFAPQVFSVVNVHRIGILDIRIVNLDRNDGNLLVRDRPLGGATIKNELVPIDHGLSLPDCLEVYTDDIAWMTWPQAKKPFGQKELDYIQALSGSKDARFLADKLGIRRECLRLMEVTTRLLQICAAAGLTLYEIGMIMYRTDRSDDNGPAQKSKLELIIERALDLALTVAGEGQARAAVSATLSGLDLNFTSQRTGGVKFSRVDSGPPSASVTPKLGPAMRSPLASPLCLPTFEADPPPYSLEGGSDLECSQETAGSMEMVMESSPTRGGSLRLSGLKGDESEVVRRSSVRQGSAYRGGGARLLRHRGSSALPRMMNNEGGDRGADTDTSIFSRPGLRGADWPMELESTFKQFVATEMTKVIAKNYGGRDKSRPAGEEAAEKRKDEAEATEPVGKEDTDESSDDDGNTLRAAFGGIMPSEREEHQAGPPRRMYMPPQIRKQLDEEAAAGQAAAEGTEVCKEPPLVATRGRYIPPQQRRADQEAPAVLASVQEEGREEEPTPPPRQKYIPPALRKAMAAEAAAKETAAVAEQAAAAVAGGAAPKSVSVVPRTPACPTDLAGGDGRIGYCFNVGPRTYMEDGLDAIRNFADQSNLELFACYDGHSGTQAVEFLKERIPALIQEQKPDFADRVSVERALANTFTTADEELLKHIQEHRHDARKKGDGEHALSPGAVGTVTLLREGVLHIANLGDCRAILCNGGTIVQLTDDHCAKDNQSERERLEAIGVEVSSDGYLHGRIAVSRAFGDWAWSDDQKLKGLIADPDITVADIKDDTEFLLLACDGIFENMSSKEVGLTVRRRLRSTGDPKAAAEFLVKMALKSEGSDNLSAIVVMFKQPPTEGEVGRTAPRLFGARKVVLAMPPEEPREESKVEPAAAADSGVTASTI